MASFGEKLRQQRELRGISLREIAEATKIAVRFLQALETDRIDVLPGGIFRRSFVREYARFVGLDPERMVSEFLHAHGDEAERVEKKPAATAATPAVDRRGFYRRFFLGVALCGLAAASWSYSRYMARAEAVRAPQPAPPAVPAMLVPGDELLASTERPAAPEAVPGPEATGPLVVTLKARADCWVSLRASGRSVFGRILREGETATVEVGDEGVLDVGDAGAIELLINDRPAPPLGDRGEVRKNILINKDSVSSLVEVPSTRRTAHSG